MTRLERRSPCKINLLLNILGKRQDGFHELETVMHPVALFDTLTFEPTQTPGVQLTCRHPELPTDGKNLVHRAATEFLSTAQLKEGIKIHLSKNIPLAAGLGGGSANAAITLQALNELYGKPLGTDVLQILAARLGSDVPFFLQPFPALGVGRGERIQPLRYFPALKGLSVLLIHPGFGVSTAWAYQALAQHPQALHGQAGRAARLIAALESSTISGAATELYNSLEVPVLRKYPVLELYQQFLHEHGALGTLMSGSGSTTFALVPSQAEGARLSAGFKQHFGETCWIGVVPLDGAGL